MSPWNRLRHLAGRILAGDDGRVSSDEAIYLTDAAHRNHQPQLAKAPEIRKRYFGADLRRGRSDGRSDRKADGDASARPSRGWLARLGLGGHAAAGEPDYTRTKIVGTPYPPSKPKKKAGDRKAEAPQADVAERPAAPATAPQQAPEIKAPAPSPAGTLPGSAPAPARRAAAALPGMPQKPAPSRAQPASRKPSDDEMLENLFGTPEPVPPQKPVPVATARAPAPVVVKTVPKAPAPVATRKRKKMDRGDVTLAALGVTLGLTCALFPWYIFFNQEKFGVREFTFSGGNLGRATPSMAYVPQPVGKPFARSEMPKMELDFFPTATLPSDQERPRALPASEQPFPSDRVNFRLVHVANGRAMIEDSDGLWVVQRGSQLPDASRVAAIEQRDGRWVLVTTHDKIVELSD